MPLGYEGYVEVDDNVCLCNSASVPNQEMPIESAAGYGGQIKTPVDEIGVRSSRVYDWPTLDGSVEVDLNVDFWTGVIGPWILDRQTAKKVEVYPRYTSSQVYQNCFWSSISLAAAEGGSTTCSLAFAALDVGTFEIGDCYLNNVLGQVDGFKTALDTGGIIEALNCSSDTVPIPYWRTTVDADGVLDGIISWSLEFSQEVVKFFLCEANSTVQEPGYLAVGPMTVSFNYDRVPLQGAFSIPDTVASLVVSLAGSTMECADLRIDSKEDAIRDGGSIVPATATYAVFELVKYT